MAITATQKAHLNKMNRASQDVLLGDIIEDVSTVLANDDITADTGAFSTTLTLGGKGVVVGVGSPYKVARGVHTTVAASDTVVTGLATVVAVVVSLGDDPTTDPFLVSATIGNQAGAPAAGSIYIKTWKATANDNVTPVAATTFTKKVNWIAIGT